MIKLEFLPKILCYCNVLIFERKYPREQSEDLHSYPLPIVPTFIMKPDLENDRNVKNTKKQYLKNTTFYEIEKDSELTFLMTNFENLSFSSRGRKIKIFNH